MKIPDIIVVGFISLPKNFIADCFFPAGTVYRFVKDQFDWVNNVFVEPLQIKRFQLVTIFLNGCSNMIFKFFFADKVQRPIHICSKASLIFNPTS